MPFTIEAIKHHADEKAEKYEDVATLLERKKIGRILEDLYSIGFIGNTGPRVRYSFRGDDNISFEAPFMVHRALWHCLTLN
jgi:hypothetical protein